MSHVHNTRFFRKKLLPISFCSLQITLLMMMTCNEDDERNRYEFVVIIKREDIQKREYESYMNARQH